MSNFNDKLVVKTLCDDIFYNGNDNLFEMTLISESIAYELIKINLNKTTPYLNPKRVLDQLDESIDLERVEFDNVTIGDVLTNVWKFIKMSDDFENAKKSLKDAFWCCQDHEFPKIIQSIQGHFDEKQYPQLVFLG